MSKASSARPSHDRLTRALAQFEGLYPETIELSLGRILSVLETFGRPQDALPPVIHVAGTNGKGSTCAFLRAMAEAAGLRVHVFSSPHLVRFNERVRLAGSLVSDEVMADCLDRTFAALNARPITHFEATTAAALLAFSETPADLMVLEVGLGGRFDATNVIDAPAVTVITPVDYDHKQFLGTDLGKIAWEKAGIMKPGVPCVSARQSDVVAQVIGEEALSLEVPLRRLRGDDVDSMPGQLSLQGRHQRANAALAGLALRIWGHPAVTGDAIEQGARTARWPARMHKLAAGPVSALGRGADVWLDGGHNPHAARAIAELLCDLPGETVLVSAMMASKDHGAFFGAMRPAAAKVFTCPNADGHASATPKALAEAAIGAGFEASAHETFEDAMDAAAKVGAQRILICGSLYLAGDVLRANGEPPD